MLSRCRASALSLLRLCFRATTAQITATNDPEQCGQAKVGVKLPWLRASSVLQVSLICGCCRAQGGSHVDGSEVIECVPHADEWVR